MTLDRGFPVSVACDPQGSHGKTYSPVSADVLCMHASQNFAKTYSPVSADVLCMHASQNLSCSTLVTLYLVER